MKRILTLLLFSVALVSNAATSVEGIQSIDVSKLTSEQKAQLLTSATTMASDAKPDVSTSEKVREEASKWVDLGGNMGRAAVGAAREVGMAANDFVGTPLGKATMAVVVYKIVGRDIVKIAIGGVLMLFSLAIGTYFLVRRPYESIEYESVPRWPAFMGSKRVVKSFETSAKVREQYTIIGFVVGMVGVLVSILIIF